MLTVNGIWQIYLYVEVKFSMLNDLILDVNL